MADIWYRAEGSGRDVIHEATTGVVAIFERHGAVMEALADAAADDPEVELAYRGVAGLLHPGHREAHRGARSTAGNMLPCNACGDRAGAVHHERELHADRAGPEPDGRARPSSSTR